MRMLLICLLLSGMTLAAQAEEFRLLDEHTGVIYGPFTYSNRTSIGVSARGELHYFTLLTESSRAGADLPSLVEEVKSHRKRRDDILSMACAYLVLQEQAKGKQPVTIEDVKRTVEKIKGAAPAQDRSPIDYTNYEIVAPPAFDPMASWEKRSKERLIIEKTSDPHGAYYIAFGDGHVELMSQARKEPATQQQGGGYSPPAARSSEPTP